MVLVGDVGAKDLALNVHRLYTGTLGDHPQITHLKGVEVRVSGATPLAIEADGELAGSTGCRSALGWTRRRNRPTPMIVPPVLCVD